MPDTITESELTAIREKFDQRKSPRAFADTMRFALAEVGITVVPDPIPEPEGDVIVVDKDQCTWFPGDRKVPWPDFLKQFGPVKIYRLEESK